MSLTKCEMDEGRNDGGKGSSFSTSLEGGKRQSLKLSGEKTQADVSHRGPAGRSCTGNQPNLKRSLGPECRRSVLHKGQEWWLLSPEMEAESSSWSNSSRTRTAVVLLLADWARAGEGLGFCISDQIQAADAATPPQAHPPTAQCFKSQGAAWLPSSRLAPDSCPSAVSVQPSSCSVILSLGTALTLACQPTSLAQPPPQPFLLTPPALGTPLPPSSTPLPCKPLLLSLLFLPSGSPTSSSQPFLQRDHAQSCHFLQVNAGSGSNQPSSCWSHPHGWQGSPQKCSLRKEQSSEKPRDGASTPRSTRGGGSRHLSLAE